MLSKAAWLEIDTHEAIKDSQHASQLKHKTGSSSEGTGGSPRVPDELTRVSAVSSEGVGTSPKVLDETLYSFEAQSDDDSFDITNTGDERTKSEYDNHEMSKEGEIVAETEEEQTANSEHE
nr:hypothetical protein [Tanacetum cinerariifolium]